MTPIAKTTEYFLEVGRYLALMGVLSYDFETREFNLRPQILGVNLSDITAYFDGK